MASLAGKVIVIAGASAGIGAAAAREFARQAKSGTRLVLAARRIEKLEQVANDCRTLAGPEAQVLTLPCDVAKRIDIDHLVAKTVEHFGRLDVMIANAGCGIVAKIHEMTEAQFDELMAINVKGTWYAMQAAAEVMLKQQPIGAGRARRGHIVAVSSGAARRGLPLYGVYSMTKAAQLSLAEAMRVELSGQGVYVSTVHPLTTSTEFFDVASSKSRLKSHGAGRAQSPETVAHKMAGLLKRPRPELWPVTGSAWMLGLAAVFPRLGDWAMAKTVNARSR